jgi:DNA-binding transcriptional LysR family regulator
MELRHLRYFVAVAESLHFGRAATKLLTAQPSLSHQIRRLEAESQASLLRRTKRHVELTEAGRLLLDEARDLLARADRAAIVARRVGRGDAQRLRVGFGYCMDQSCLVAVMGQFTARPRFKLKPRRSPCCRSSLSYERDGSMSDSCGHQSAIRR